jgi:cell division septal protein FtsQ
LQGEDNSPASFEKTLSALAEKISKSQAQLDSLRGNGRRLKALWTLYASFAYLLCVIIMVLVVGWKKWSYMEYTAVAGSPLL